jgi:hypothetical protein
MAFFRCIWRVHVIVEVAGEDNKFPSMDSPWRETYCKGRALQGGVARGKLLAQAKTMHRRGIEIGEAPQRRRNEIDLFHIGTAGGAGCEMQADQDFGQDGKAAVQILGGSIREIAASESAVDPL